MKHVAAVLLAAVLALPSPALAAEGSGFSDVAEGDWFAPYVEVCAEDGLMIGLGDGRFDPMGAVNTDEAVVMAARVLWQADGGSGPLPKGPSVEEFAAEVGEDISNFPFLDSPELTQEYASSWSWDGYTYLFRRAREAGASFDGGLIYSYSADRYDFFHLLGFAAQGLELPERNPLDAVPGTREEGILDLYRAGILAGTDGYGAFDGQKGLTRAEAAAALARIARPELRLSFEPLPFPYEGYTLTPLRAYSGSYGVNYPVFPLVDGDILLIDGGTAPWPPMGSLSFGLYRSRDYCHFQGFDRATEDPWDTLTCLMDREGNIPVPPGAYDDLQATGDGHLIGIKREGDTTRWFHLNTAGEVEAELPSTVGTTGNDWWGFNQWVCPWRDEEQFLWGYKNQEGGWAVEPTWAEAWPFQNGYAVVQDYATGLYGVLGLDGELVLPYQYTNIEPFWNSPGCEAPGYFAVTDRDGRAGWVAPDGTWYDRDPGLNEIPTYQNGYAVCWDGGYDKSYSYYLGPDTLLASERFDWCGDIGPDGAGFVGMDGMIFRIQFE